MQPRRRKPRRLEVDLIERVARCVVLEHARSPRRLRDREVALLVHCTSSGESGTVVVRRVSVASGLTSKMRSSTVVEIVPFATARDRPSGESETVCGPSPMEMRDAVQGTVGVDGEAHYRVADVVRHKHGGLDRAAARDAVAETTTEPRTRREIFIPFSQREALPVPRNKTYERPRGETNGLTRIDSMVFRGILKRARKGCDASTLRRGRAESAERRPGFCIPAAKHVGQRARTHSTRRGSAAV